MVDKSHTSPVYVEDQVLLRYSSLVFVLGVVEHLGRPALDQFFQVDDVSSLGRRRRRRRRRHVVVVVCCVIRTLCGILCNNDDNNKEFTSAQVFCLFVII